MQRRVVITGIGLITPIGNDLETTWSSLLAGKNGAGPTTLFDVTEFATKFSCEVKDWEPSKYFDKRELKHLDRFLQFGVAAGMQAVADAGFGTRVPAGQEHRWGTFIGAGLGGVRTIEDTYAASKVKGPRHGISPYFVTDIIINELPGMVSIRTGATGPNISHVSACSTGAHSIGEAFRTIRHGYADGMICGGAEATISILGVGGFNSMRAMSTRNDDPQHASRPFDKDRDGFVIGEGAGVVVLEELELAKKRGARIYAELDRLRREQRRASRRGAGTGAQGRAGVLQGRARRREARIRARSRTSTRTAPRPISTTRTRRSRSRRCSATTRRSSRSRRPSR